VLKFLADRTARSMIGYWHENVVRLPVRPFVCDALQWSCISNTKCVRASEKEVPPMNTILQLSAPYTNPECPKTTHVMIVLKAYLIIKGHQKQNSV